jgi:hypothetical protein
MTNWKTITPDNCIVLNSPPTEEVILIDKEGFHYKGQFIADAGEAYELMVQFLKNNLPAPHRSELKEQALKLLDKAEDPSWDINDFSIVRKALEQLPES